MSWWHRLWHRTQMEEQLDKELRFHFDQQVADLIGEGFAPAEARRRTRFALGGHEQLKEACRDARGTRWIEDFGHDIRYALRTFHHQPGFAVAALLTLALGTGAATVMFSVVSGVLLKPLPYPQPDRLVAVNGHTETWNTEVYGEQNLANLDFRDGQRDTRTLEMAGSVYNGGTVSGSGNPEYVYYREISSNLFSVLGVPLTHGRSFLPEEDRLGAAPVAILGHSFWERHFAADLSALGTSLVLDQKSYAVVGIARPGFQLNGEEPDVLIPLGQDAAGYLQGRRVHPVSVVGRLRPGATLEQARQELSLLGNHLAEQFPDTNKGRSFTAQPLRPDVGEVRSTLWLLLGAVSLVLLIACANVASLMLARAVSRERELAMRVALGASRSRLARQCLTESAVLGIAGGLLGVLLASAGIQPFVALWPGSLPRAEEVQLDWRVLLFAIGVSLLSGILFGLAPALRAPTKELEQILRSGTRSVPGGARRLHSGFVIAEIAFALVLLVAAGMLGRTLLRLSTLDPGVDTRNVLVARMALSPAILPNPQLTRAAWQDVLDRARRVPGVQSVAIVDTVPMREGHNQLGYSTSPDLPPANQQPFALATSVTTDYLQVMGIPLRRGRFFDDHDRLGSELVVVIDEVFAQSAFRAQDAVGKHLWFPDMASGPVKIVGVVGHVRHWGLAGDDHAKVRAQFYYPFAQVPDGLVRRWSELISLAVRTGVPPLQVVESLRQELRGAAGDQVLYQVHTMEQLSKGTLALQRFLLLLFGIFAVLALLLACVGVYGVLAYLTGRRIPEMGVRIAVGASAGDVMWLVLRQSLGIVFAGVSIGAIAALGAARLLARLVEGMQPTAPGAFLVTIPVLVLAAFFASLLPARRAGRIDPVIALRQD
jgi:predicted permease